MRNKKQSMSFEDKIIKYGENQNIPELEEVIRETPTEDLIGAISKRLNGPYANAFWNYLLRGFNDSDASKEKRFLCVKSLLKQLNKVEFTYKHTELIKRLCVDLPRFTNDQLIEIVDFCIDSVKIGDPKCTGWKELLPEAIDVISVQNEISLQGVRSTGSSFRATVVRNLCTMKWPLTVLTPLANMFRDIELTNEEISTILTKFCYNLQKLEPLELPTLAFQVFSLCKSASQLILPILAINRYFHKYYYKKQITTVGGDTSSTDFNSIVDHSEKELREAEETVLHHLSYCTQSKITEHQMVYVLRGLSASPDVILTPFVLSALISMSKINRDPDSSLAGSVILPFLRNVVKNNEDEKDLYKISAWCRDTFQVKQVDLEQIFTILIDQNKEGKDVVTPGLINLAFILLKAKSIPKLNSLAISFLQNFIKKRFIFGQGVVETIADWMILEQDALQYSECLTTLSLSDAFTMSECVKTIKSVMEFFLKISGENAMRMMSFVLPVVKISHVIRDAFIDILKKAMYSRDPDTCRMGVFGFCMLLKQLNNNNSQRATLGARGMFTQQSISGYSRSQSTVGDRNNAQRHFDILTLEIVGLLRNCFNYSLKIKETLYESLTRAVELNPKLTPHILKFIEPHFIQYFKLDETICEIQFEKIVIVENDYEKEISVKDNLGKLTMFVACCIIMCDTYELEYDSAGIKNVFSTIIEKIVSKHLDLMELSDNFDHKINQLTMQKLNFLEALMYYEIWTSKTTNDNVKKLFDLFKRHRNIRDSTKTIQNSQIKKKPTKKGKDETQNQTQNVTINGNVVKKVVFKPENIWDLPTIERFLRLLHEDIVSFASFELTGPLRNNRGFVRYSLEVTATRLEGLRHQPRYKQLTHSKRILKYLTEITRVLYERCIKKLPEIWLKFDTNAAYLSAECFRQSLISAEEIFSRKFSVYLKEVDLPIAAEHKKITTVLQELIEAALNDQEVLHQEAEGKKLPAVLFQCLEILYENRSWDDDSTLEGYNWIFKLCENYEFHVKDLCVAHNLLFYLRQKTKTGGGFYDTIAMHLEKVLGRIDEEIEMSPQFALKSITEATAESCIAQLLLTIRKQIDQVEYFIAKSNNLHFKLKIVIEDDHDTCIQQLKSVERSICSQLIHISNILLHLTNVCIPSGSCVDGLAQVLILMYISLTNLTRHFVARHATLPISLQGTKFEQLLKTAGKILGKRVYNFISYIETDLIENNLKRKTANDPQVDRAKILKETKFVPRLILRIENFNKFVILLSKKMNSHLSHYLHSGTVRDFRIKTSELKEAIDQTMSHSSQIEDNESALDQLETEPMTDEDNLIFGNNLQNIQYIACTRTSIIETSESSSSSSGKLMSPDSNSNSSDRALIENESEDDSYNQVMQNLAKINEKVQKRKRKESTDGEPSKKNTRGGNTAKRGRRKKQ